MAKNLKRIVVVDVEATCWEPHESRPEGARSEIIEVGYAECVRNSTTGRWSVGLGQSLLVLPEHSTVSPFCTALTGHTQDRLELGGATYLEAVRALRVRFPKLHLFPWASWGDYDREMFAEMARLHLNRLPEEVREATVERRKAEAFKSLPLEAYPFGRTHLNLKTICGLLMGSADEVDLKAAMARLGLTFEGEAHRGSVDAWNTARLLCTLLNTNLVQTTPTLTVSAAVTVVGPTRAP